MDDNITLLHADIFNIADTIRDNSVDVIYVDPPYLLSNDGFTCKNGKKVSVNKGKWDRSLGFNEDIKFHDKWLSICSRVLKDNGTIFISGTYHNIYKCGYLLQQKGWHILNDITWYKPNASPNLSCRMLTAAHETILWAKKRKQAKHTFNYELVKTMDFPRDDLKNAGKQMRSVWSISTPTLSEKQYGKHPTQKPLALMARILLCSSNHNDLIFDPFMGSGTMGVACKKLSRRYTGVEIEKQYYSLAQKRILSSTISK